MNNSLLNGVLAILKNAPERAREYLRQPGANVKSVSDVYIAIVREVDNSNNREKLICLRGVLNKALRLVGDNEDYFKGIIAVEQLIEAEIDGLRSRVGQANREETEEQEDKEDSEAQDS
jgi:hypothetical protein